MRLRLDFAHPRPRPTLLGWLLLGLGIVAMGWAGWRYQTVAASLNVEKTRAAALMREAPRRPGVATPRKAQGPVAESGLTTTRALLRTDWGALMGGLESARTPKIGLLSLDLDTGRGGSLAITAEARDHAAMLAYVETLEALPMLDKVALDSHAERERDGERAVRFSLKARWHLSGRAP
ncbi:MAG: PilN domain-containing protein [Thiobacillaceae bacterium]|jgi:hypothetical protein|nr:PilN domain-containing protein [Thiobacillaceae bacterium]